MLNCLTVDFSDLWNKTYKIISGDSWSKRDFRLCDCYFSDNNDSWSFDRVLRSDYLRRQALVEIDVLVSMALGMSLDELKTIYRIQFPVLAKYEDDTWYDKNGRIVFSSKNYGDLTYKRPEWENNIKGAPAGKIFTREIEDDTMPGGPVKRTIKYVAPFDKCDREQDYETAWKFFEEKYGK